MKRKQKCSNCGEWYYNHNGLFIVLPDTYDDDICRKCNTEIDERINKSLDPIEGGVI